VLGDNRRTGDAAADACPRPAVEIRTAPHLEGLAAKDIRSIPQLRALPAAGLNGRAEPIVAELGAATRIGAGLAVRVRHDAGLPTCACRVRKGIEQPLAEAGLLGAVTPPVDVMQRATGSTHEVWFGVAAQVGAAFRVAKAATVPSMVSTRADEE